MQSFAHSIVRKCGPCTTVTVNPYSYSHMPEEFKSQAQSWFLQADELYCQLNSQPY